MTKKHIISLSKIFLIVLSFAVLGASTGCKGKKDIVVDDTKQKAEIQQVINQLNSLISNDANKSIADREKELNEIKSKNYTDPTILNLIKQCEQQLEKEKKELEEKLKQQTVVKLSNEQKVEKYFNDIANAPSVDEANRIIEEALTMFKSNDALLLIIISKEGDIVDYDRPSTIKKYLNYVKDQKKSINKVEKLIMDGNKIKEIELIK